MKASKLGQFFTAAVLGPAALSGLVALGIGPASTEATAAPPRHVSAQSTDIRLADAFNGAPTGWSKRACIVRGRGWVICFRNDYAGDQPPDWDTNKYVPFQCPIDGYKSICTDGRSYRN